MTLGTSLHLQKTITHEAFATVGEVEQCGKPRRVAEHPEFPKV